jgi:hypothetical protein
VAIRVFQPMGGVSGIAAAARLPREVEGMLAFGAAEDSAHEDLLRLFD